MNISPVISNRQITNTKVADDLRNDMLQNTTQTTITEDLNEQRIALPLATSGRDCRYSSPTTLAPLSEANPTLSHRFSY